MAGIGIRRTRTVLIDGNERITLDVSRFQDGVSDNSTQDIYADGSQRVVEGFSTESNIIVVCQEVPSADFRWLTLPYQQKPIVFRRWYHLRRVAEDGAAGAIRHAWRGIDQDYDLRLEFLIVTETVNDYLERGR